MPMALRLNQSIGFLSMRIGEDVHQGCRERRQWEWDEALQGTAVHRDVQGTHHCPMDQSTVTPVIHDCVSPFDICTPAFLDEILIDAEMLGYLLAMAKQRPLMEGRPVVPC